MLFTQIEFFIFYFLILVIVTAMNSYRAQKLILLMGSYYFYGYWDWRFLSLVFFSTTVDYLIGLRLSRIEDDRKRKQLLIASLIINLGILGFFKYYNFFVDSLMMALKPFGFRLETLSIILPVGISFYTFQSLSYTIDVYRRNIKPCRNFLDFALFISFFPQLVAGPIVRASEFLPQLKQRTLLTYERFFYGFKQFIFGFFKKVFIADRLAFFVDNVFTSAGIFDGLTTWLAVFAYSIQIYCDFSGYSDMAIGSARILGYDLNQNFNLPYMAQNIQDFWRRWHISFSTWLRDYLYIPLGGSRKGPIRTYVNLMLTMLLGGLWHGAAWTFVFWGGLHGFSLAVNRYVSSRNKQEQLTNGHIFLNWMLTMLVVLIGWVFFRAGTFANALRVLNKMFLDTSGVAWYSPVVIFILFLIIARHMMHITGMEKRLALTPTSRFAPSVLLAMLGIAVIFYPKGFQPFIYFQF